MAGAVPNLRVLGGPERRGKGHGIRQAVRVAAGAFVGFSDADNKTPIDEFDKVLPHLHAGADVVIGSRGLSASSIARQPKLYRPPRPPGLPGAPPPIPRPPRARRTPSGL